MGGRELNAARSDAREYAGEEIAVGFGVGRGLGGGRADLAAFDHHGTVETARLQALEHGGEVDLTGAKLDHHVGLALAGGVDGDRAIFRAETGDVLDDGFQFFDRVFAGVVDDVAGVVPDFEILVPDGLDRAQDFRRGAAAAAVGFHDELDAALCREGRRVGHDFEILFVTLGFVLAESEGEFDAHGVAVFDLLAGVGDGRGELERGVHAEGGHVNLEAAGGDFLFERGEVFWGRAGAGKRVVLGGREQTGVGVARGFDGIERLVVRPLGPRAIETTDRPSGAGGSGEEVARQERGGSDGGRSGEEMTAGERVHGAEG